MLTNRPRLAPARTGARPTSVDTTANKPAPAQGRPKGGSFWLLTVLVGILCLTGVVMVLSASSITSLQKYGTPWHFFIRQVGWLFIGSLGFGLALRVDHHRWRRLSRPAMYVCVALLFAVLVPGVGVRTAGASRWLGTSSLQLQPSELAKLALVFFAADLLDRRAGERDWRYQMLPVIGMFIVLAVLVMAQPDMGTTMVLACIALSMLWMAGLPARPMAGVLAGGAAAFLLLAVAAPYRWKRMTSFVNPFKDPTDTGYQSVQALLALSHGHLVGDGIGSSIASYGYLPNAQTDFIFAVIGEETGLLGGLLLSGLFLIFALVGIRVACRAPSRYSAFLAAGITAWLVGQAIINIGAVVGLLPVTGVPLPFVSFGGSSLVIAMFGAGLLANIAKQS